MINRQENNILKWKKDISKGERRRGGEGNRHNFPMLFNFSCKVLEVTGVPPQN